MGAKLIDGLKGLQKSPSWRATFGIQDRFVGEFNVCSRQRLAVVKSNVSSQLEDVGFVVNSLPALG
jgi:hypothetical protein